MQSIKPIIRALLPRDFTQVDIDEAVRTARAEAIGEAVAVAKAHVHVPACDGIGCKQVITVALEGLKGSESK
jgi:hypothetical protein